jgi:hypothetical protein
MKITLSDKKLIISFLNAVHVVVSTAVEQPLEVKMPSELSEEAIALGFTMEFVEKILANSKLDIEYNYNSVGEFVHTKAVCNIENDQILFELLLMARNFHRSHNVAFLMGFQESTKNNSSLLKLKTNVLFEKNLLKEIFQYADLELKSSTESKEDMCEFSLKCDITDFRNKVLEKENEMNVFDKVHGRKELEYNVLGTLRRALYYPRVECYPGSFKSGLFAQQKAQPTVNTYCGFKPGFLLRKNS